MKYHKVKQEQQTASASLQASKQATTDQHPTSEDNRQKAPKKPSGQPTQATRTTAKVKPRKQARGTNTSQTASDKPRTV